MLDVDNKSGILKDVTTDKPSHTSGNAEAPVFPLTGWDIDPPSDTRGPITEVSIGEWDWEEFDTTVEFQRLSSEQVDVMEMRGWLQVAESTLWETWGDGQPDDVHEG